MVHSYCNTRYNHRQNYQYRVDRSKSLCLIFLCLISYSYILSSVHDFIPISVYIKMGIYIYIYTYTLNRIKWIHIFTQQLPFTFRVLLPFRHRYFYWRILETIQYLVKSSGPLGSRIICTNVEMIEKLFGFWGNRSDG